MAAHVCVESQFILQWQVELGSAYDFVGGESARCRFVNELLFFVMNESDRSRRARGRRKRENFPTRLVAAASRNRRERKCRAL